MEQKQPEPVRIEIDEATARGAYTNLALISHSETEMIFDFLFVQPQTTKAKVVTRIISSPVHAKRFLWALKDNIQKYEARYGAIPAGDDPQGRGQPAGVYQ